MAQKGLDKILVLWIYADKWGNVGMWKQAARIKKEILIKNSIL